MTKSFLESKINTVYEDFVEESWCELNNRDLNVDGYTSSVYQQRYMLKYYGAYFCELYGMYERYFQDFDGTELNVLSLGCGSGIDCEALNRVIIDLELDIDINYVGVDIVDWSYRPQLSWATFKLMCISELVAKDVRDVDLFVFPKSLTELDSDTLDFIGKLIAKSNKKDLIYFLNTYVTDHAADSSRVDGITQFGVINKHLKAKSWECLTSPLKYYYKRNCGWLGYSYNFFKLPDDVKPFVEELKDNCNNHNGSTQCINCDIDFIPIFTSKYLAYNLLGYERLE